VAEVPRLVHDVGEDGQCSIDEGIDIQRLAAHGFQISGGSSTLTNSNEVGSILYTAL
jgi:hypothetical protein